jgi:hypothetical protein
MRLRNIFIALILQVPLILFSQDSTFNMVFPDDWIQFQRADVLKSVAQKYKLNDSAKAELLANRKSVQLFGYAAPQIAGMKYRPNIQVLLLPFQMTNFEQFKMSIAMSLGSFKSVMQNMKVVVPITEVTIAGRKAIYAKITGDMITKSGDRTPVSSRIYAIPSGAYIYQVMMNDTEDYNCDAEFDKALLSIEL